ncbi:hypothetical protein J6590_002939 [Homalodisca vitripennis]|nr:hypothetical protein J6590_002939 [Homalodisca vitripennis]
MEILFRKDQSVSWLAMFNPVTSLQSGYRRVFYENPTDKRNIYRWCKKFEETGLVALLITAYWTKRGQPTEYKRRVSRWLLYLGDAAAESPIRSRYKICRDHQEDLDVLQRIYSEVSEVSSLMETTFYRELMFAAGLILHKSGKKRCRQESKRTENFTMKSIKNSFYSDPEPIIAYTPEEAVEALFVDMEISRNIHTWCNKVPHWLDNSRTITGKAIKLGTSLLHL